MVGSLVVEPGLQLVEVGCGAQIDVHVDPEQEAGRRN
jgi:hypothetical protein